MRYLGSCFALSALCHATIAAAAGAFLGNQAAPPAESKGQIVVAIVPFAAENTAREKGAMATGPAPTALRTTRARAQRVARSRQPAPKSAGMRRADLPTEAASAPASVDAHAAVPVPGPLPLSPSDPGAIDGNEGGGAAAVVENGKTSAGDGNGSSGGGGDGSTAGEERPGSAATIGEYLRAVERRIDERKSYPKAARRLGIEGRVTAKLGIRADGELLFVAILDADQELLADEVRNAVTRAAPFPPLPSHFGRPQVELVVPLLFRLTHVEEEW
ncbi:MAG: TonB family protein [Deltaproteobacteria bacterium]|nr:TonB family protein [Deltaproteobacteria bacterium]